MRKLILKNSQSPGDIVMLTAAVRDLHRSYPGQFVTDVQTPCGQLWENNPLVTQLDAKEAQGELIQCEYPLIHQSNQGPFHFICRDGRASPPPESFTRSAGSKPAL